ncbi:hypothetical protein SAMN05421870_102117 [Streptomyces qinglanensis]|uniref:Tetratricopeptide repeat-containing protein n=1 Tax=Streptomyces qinglanensis TaxID=943816 RepID=A0A1H9PN30_9ACTN|nr:sel1 repeat family protein [Streptomyces qinglanensis]SER49219.1 hypothetical protein SAMN05421870_102117 [Streptomyces qinglanensis]
MTSTGHAGAGSTDARTTDARTTDIGAGGGAGSTGAGTAGSDAEERAYRTAAEHGDAADQHVYAEFLVGRGRVDDAVRWLEEAARGGDPRAARLRAVTAKDRGQYTVAAYWYRTAAERDGACAFGLAELLWERLDDREGAAEWYARGAALGSVECRTNGALLLLSQGRSSEAEVELARAAPHDHVAGRIEQRMAELGERIDLHRARILELTALLGLPPEERPADLPERVAEFLVDAEECAPFSELHTEPEWFTSYPSFLPEAEKAYVEARALGNPRTDQWHALLYYNLDRYEDACRVLADGLRRHPDSRLLYRSLSAVHFQYGELSEYEASLRPGAEAGDRIQQRRLGDLCREQWRTAEARRWLEAAEAGADGDDDPYEAAADSLAKLEEDERTAPPALSAAEESRLPALHAAARTGDQAAELELGRLAEKLHRYPEAVGHYRRAAAAPDASASAVDGGAGGAEQARGAGRNGGEDGSPAAVASPASLASPAAVAAYALGRMLYEECGAHEKAVVPLYLPAARAGDLDAVEGLGALYVRLDDPLAAEPWLRRAARFGRPEAAGWIGNRVGDSYGDMEEAVRWWTRAAKGGKVWYGWRAGKQLVRWRRYEEAEALLRLAWTGREEQEALHEAAYWLARALRGQARTAEAVEWLRTAREVHPLVRLGYSGFMLTSLFDPSMELAELLVDEIATPEAYEEAAALLAAVPETSPKHRAARDLLARVPEQG